MVLRPHEVALPFILKSSTNSINQLTKLTSRTLFDFDQWLYWLRPYNKLFFACFVNNIDLKNISLVAVTVVPALIKSLLLTCTCVGLNCS